MPEPSFLSLYSMTPEPPKTSSIIKQSCGIGDTDGFPAFDVDSETYATKDDSKWGFLITGGAEFHMPLTVFQVTPDGLADKGGICLGDIILEINEEDASNLTLSQAHEKIDGSGKKIFFLVKSMDDEEPIEGYEAGEERTVLLRVPKPIPPPPASAIEKRLQELQRKLSEIAEIPRILSSTLATVTQTFDKLTTNITPCQHLNNGSEYYQYLQDQEQKRKLSYDEDVYDYELSDDNDCEDDDNDNDKSGIEKEFDSKEEYLQLKRYAAKQRKSKDVTPESDYASENNYPLKAEDEEDKIDKVDANINEDDDYMDDDDDICDKYKQFNLSVLKTASGHASQDESETEEEEEDDDDEAVNSVDEDFLTTTFTWNLRNKPKLQINGRDNYVINSYQPDAKNGAEQTKSLNDSQQSSNTMNENLSIEKFVEKPTEHKLDKLERCWPWADREKIIYKQSTCHLVPHKPLGLIEQRIQLLAKRNLLEHLNKTTNPQ